MAIIMGSVTYGKNTASNFSTYQELFYILDEKLPFFLIKMCDRFSEADTRFQLNSGVAYFKWLPAADQQCPAVPPGLVDEIKAKLATVLAPTRSNSLNTSLASPTLTSPVTLTANSVDEATNSLASTTLQGERTAAVSPDPELDALSAVRLQCLTLHHLFFFLSLPLSLSFVVHPAL